MKKIITVLTLFMMILGHGQTTIVKSSIDSGGASVTNGTTSILYTIGEVAIQETSVGNIHISEGFINSNSLETLGVENYSQLEGIKIFPNPTTNFVNIHFATIDTYEVTVFNTSGKQINKINVRQSNQQKLNLENYSNGLYLIVIKNTKKQTFKTFKLLKN